MGNILRCLTAQCCQPSTVPQDVPPGVSALAHDIFQFEINSQVPDGLNKHVVSSKKAQANWYKKLLVAWRGAKPPPRTPEEAATLFNLRQHPGAKFELHTLPVDIKAVADGDTVTVYVSTKDPRESSCVPKEVQTAAVQRSKARAQKNYAKADELHKKIVDNGYRMLNVQNEEVLGRKGIDAPESSMPFGQEAKEELVKLVQGKSLKVLVYDQDRYGRCVGDVFCNGTFVQEVLLKKGLAWHYTAYYQRLELANSEKDARKKRVGLWSFIKPAKTLGMEERQTGRQMMRTLKSHGDGGICYWNRTVYSDCIIWLLAAMPMAMFLSTKKVKGL